MHPDPSPAWQPQTSAALVGVSRRDITPPVGIRTANWGAPGRYEVSEGVHQPLTATVVALADETGSRLVLVSLDLGWWRQIDDERALRGPILNALGLEPEQLLVHLVHTHAGPTTNSGDKDRPGGQLLAEYMTELTGSVIDACRDAVSAARECIITWGQGHCPLATVRDLPCGDLDLVAFNPDVPADDTVIVGRITDCDGSLVATVVNYACHPTTLAWQNPLVSPDFVGPARRLVEETTSAPCVFLQGASGDLAPRDQYTGDVDVAERNGRILGHSVMTVLENLPQPGHGLALSGVVESGATLGMWSPVPLSASPGLEAQMLHVRVPLQAPVTADDLRRRWSHLKPVTIDERLDRATALRRGYADEDHALHPVWISRVGEAIIVAHPGEAYSLLQRELRARFPKYTVLVLNCTNGPGFMYLPESSAYERAPYQVWQTLLAAGALEAVIEAVDAAITVLPTTRSDRPVGIR